MRFLIICRVIDHYGDAGFSLRLALSLCQRGHIVNFLIDNFSTLKKIRPKSLPPSLTVTHIHSRDAFMNFCETLNQPLHAVIECFGSSSSCNSNISNDQLQHKLGQIHWLIIEYLTAETWNEQFHLKPSINPQTGYQSLYVYPGFSSRTGGLIYQDLPHTPIPKTKHHKTNQIFVFCYPSSPLEALIRASTNQFEIHTVGLQSNQPIVNLEFCPINEFDHRLRDYDWCFVRGEDSFVRAQLNGIPFVWQVYKTADQAHRIKLHAFFNLFTEHMDNDLREKLKLVWLGWNEQTTEDIFMNAWIDIQSDYDRLLTYCQNWASTLLRGKELTQTVEFLALQTG